VRKEMWSRLHLLLAVAFVVAATPGAAQGVQEVHSDLCFKGCPMGTPPTNDLIIRDIYILCSNDETKFADWVAYKVTADTINRTARLSC